LEADKWMSNLIKECRLGDPDARPTAFAVSQIFENYLVQSEDDDSIFDSIFNFLLRKLQSNSLT